jgi:hypothetical protein
MRNDAAARAAAVPSYGFYGDPQSPVAGRYYGNLVWVGGDLTAATVPGAPNLTSATSGNTSINLAWTAPADTGGAAISGYKVYRGTSAGGEAAVPVATLLNVLSYSDSGLTNGTTYFYKVAAVNSVGTGAQSNERSATPAAPAAPGAISGTVTNATTAAAISGATVTIQGGASTTTDGSGNYTFSNVTPGSYNVSASASGYTSSGLSAATVNSGATTTRNFALSPIAASAPGAPNLTAVGRGFTHGINLSWTVPANNGSTITSYSIYRSTASAGPYTLIATVGAVTAYSDTGNPTFRYSYYKVLAVNAIGPGPYSNVASAFSF